MSILRARERLGVCQDFSIIHRHVPKQFFICRDMPRPSYSPKGLFANAPLVEYKTISRNAISWLWQLLGALFSRPGLSLHIWRRHLTMTRPPSHHGLLNLLYEKTVPAIRPKVPIVKRVLYEVGSSPEASKSVLDDLMQFQWSQKPLEAAIEDVKKAGKTPLTNILKLSCKNAYVSKSDLYNIYPVVRDRRYLLKSTLKNGIDFCFVKARNPLSLMYTGSFYLIFRNYNQACAYFLETQKKVLNGMSMDLQFVQPSERHLKQMASPFLDDPKFIKPKENIKHLIQNFHKTPIQEIFASSGLHLDIIKQLLVSLHDYTKYMGLEEDPMYGTLARFSYSARRSNLVVVRNLPFGITGPALHDLLWDYEFATDENPRASIHNLNLDPVSQVSTALLNFKNVKHARRFVRNYHGRRWEKVMSRKEKALYEPILCEILD